MCCRLLWKYSSEAQVHFIGSLFTFPPKRNCLSLIFSLLSDENGNIFWNPIEMSVLFCLSIVVSFTRMGCHRQCQYCPGPGRTKDGYLARQNMLFLFFFSWQKFHCSRPQKMCALWSKTNYGFYLLTFNHYLFRASEGKWEIGFVGICSSCSN